MKGKFASVRAAAQAGVIAPVARFRRDETASLSVEAALITPLLLWAFLAVYTYFDVYREKNLALKANYAVSDLLSRETNPIDMGYINGAAHLYRYLTRTPDAESWMRVTVVHCSNDCADQNGNRTLEIDWSRGTDGVDRYTDANVNAKLGNAVPLIASGERVIVVETSKQYDVPITPDLTGVGNRTFFDLVVTRPRFAEQLCFEGVGCGA